MKQMSLRTVFLLAFTVLFAAGIVILLVFYAKDAPAWTSYPANRHIYTDGVLTGAGEITDRTGTVLAKTENGARVYNESAAIRKATLHAVGDPEGFITTGVQSSFWKQLTGYSRIGGVFQPSGQGNNMRLTLSASLNVTALNALGSRKGTIGVYNYKTGELLCMVSTPTYDVNDKPDIEGDKSGKYTGAYLNRFLSATYPPGSTFKLVTAAAAIETFSDMGTRKYTCKQGVEIDGEWISCLGNHGTLGFEDALAHSCNAYFSQLAVDLGAETLTKYAEKLGFNKHFSLDGVDAKESEFDVSGARDIDLAWAGMGQYTDMVNPLHYLTMMGAIANHGVPVKPYLVESITSPGGIPLKFRLSRNGSRMLDADTADTLSDMMRGNVLKYYGKGTFPGLEVCGKTGTAEVGEDQASHAWFVGFVRDEACPLAFVVIVENAGSGLSVAAPIANRMLQEAKDLV